ncbi:MAG: hypothetical protein ACPG5U_01335 [Planktomarina sp.]
MKISPRILTVVLAGAILAGCAAPTPPSPQIAGVGVGPGNSLPSPRLAGEIFANVCLKTLPRFAGAKTAIAAYPFTQHPTSGTYYHDFENLSVKLHNDTCSMVFGSPSDPAAVIPQLAQGTKATINPVPRNIDITSRPGPDGLRYFRMGIKKSGE